MSTRGRPPKNGTPFDRLLKKQCQKGVAASKSSGVVGKWGSTSFTSVRSASGSEPVRPKKFFKSKNSGFEAPGDCYDAVGSTRAAVDPKPQSKFFKSRNSQPIAEPAKPVKPLPPLRPLDVTSNQPVVAKEEVMKVPPLKLRLKLAQLAEPEPRNEANEDSNCSTGSGQSSQPSEDAEISFKEPSILVDPGQKEECEPVKPVLRTSSRTTRKHYGSSSPETEPTEIEPGYQRQPALRTSSRRTARPCDYRPTSPEQQRTEPEPECHEEPMLDPGTRIANQACDYECTIPEPQHAVPEPEASKLTVHEPGPMATEKPSTYSRTRRTRNTAPDHRVDRNELEKPAVAEPADPEPEQAECAPSPQANPRVESLSEPIVLSDEPLAKRLKPEPEQPGLKKAASIASDTNISAEMAPPVAKQKRSIFKSKTQTGQNGATGGKKGISLYKHKWSDHQDRDDDFKSKVFSQVLSGKPAGDAGSSLDFDDFPESAGPSNMSFSSLTRVASEPKSASDFDDTFQEVVSVKCPRGQKDYFTVIKNVKKAHQIQDSGEFQEFNDDVEYIMDGLKATNSLSTRCLSTVTLASKCMEPPFRMHLRAHGTMNRFFSELKDAPQNSSLSLCTATVLFVLSQDRLNMDMDRDSLELMLNLLDTDSRIKDALDGAGMNKRELEKNKQKVQELCAAMKSKGHAANLSLEKISADHLSMETLLSLTSKRAGEWFKEELRELGGLDHLVRTMNDCVSFLTADEISMWTEPLHNKMRKADRVLKVLESVTHENEENCQYLLKFQGGKFLDLIHTLFKLVDEEVPLNPNRDINDRDSVPHSLMELLFDVMRVYINLVHDYNQASFGSRLSGEKTDMFDMALHCMFVMPDYLPVEKRFDILVLTLTLLINLVEHCEENRERLLKTKVPLKNEELFTPIDEQKTAAEGLVLMFLDREENAMSEESKTDAILDGVKDEDDEVAKKKNDEDERKKTEQEVIDETVAKLLQKAGRHMEHTLIASYITLIIGYLIMENKDREEHVRRFLPENNFANLASVLKKFFNFMNLTAASTVTSNRGIKATETVLKYLEKIDQPDEPPVKKEESFDDLTLFDVTKDDSSLNLSNATTCKLDLDNSI